MRRRPASRGLSYFDANRGRLVTEGPDVLEIKHEIEARWPGVLSCFFDLESDEWVVVEHCKDSCDRMVLSTKSLNRKTIEKLQRIDQAAHAQGDLNAKFEAEADQVERDKDKALAESLDHERLFHALRKDGLIHRPEVFFPSR